MKRTGIPIPTLHEVLNSDNGHTIGIDGWDHAKVTDINVHGDLYHICSASANNSRGGGRLVYIVFKQEGNSQFTYIGITDRYMNTLSKLFGAFQQDKYNEYFTNLEVVIKEYKSDVSLFRSFIDDAPPDSGIVGAEVFHPYYDPTAYDTTVANQLFI